VDLDVIQGDTLSAVNEPASAGMQLAELREALRVLAAHPNLLALDIAGYNPELDASRAAAQMIVDLLVEIVSERLENPEATPATSVAVPDAVSHTASEPAAATPTQPDAATDAPSPTLHSPEQSVDSAHHDVENEGQVPAADSPDAAPEAEHQDVTGSNSTLP
jgi:hypothetical protein